MSNTSTNFIEFGVPGDKILVPRIGLGTMNLSGSYGSANEEESLAVLNHAIKKGCVFWDSADVYSLGQNETLVGKALKDNRDKIVLCTKFGHEFMVPEIATSDHHKGIVGINGKPEYVARAAEASLKRLGVDRIDVYYQHRVDPNVPIEETVAAMAELVRQGKVRYLGLSECSAETLRRAYKVHPIAAVEYEYNLWSLDLETNGILEACRELGVTLVAYSPLGRGFLTGQIRSFDDLEETDIRRRHPRFQPGNFEKNLELVTFIEELAARKGCTASQIALAWVLAQEKNLIVIPGTRRVKYLDQNISANTIILSDDELKEIRNAIAQVEIVGTRYPKAMMEKLNL
ncbi:hypothetical protein H4R20_002086 [Coemansia guatemalensis]|uniref:NADP-dependent oxidoreductase domain-containing protein n=1 Tax=Coemansia guatemalensis TaxID=2761395 RepID=A0A9W8I364_9FUNG|nr:hypothetical protein H4R20_002086 [Coemansia guatemalensis]